MKKNLHNIDKLFRRFLEDYEEDPAENVWALIENDLNKADAEKHKAKPKFLLRTGACIALLLTSLLLNDIIQTYNYNLKRNHTSFEGLKVKSSTEKNATENESNNKLPNRAYVAKPPDDNLYTFKNGILNSNIENAGNKIFQDDKLYGHNNPVQSIESGVVFDKKNHLPPFSIDSDKQINFLEPALGKNLITEGQQNKHQNKSLRLKSKHDFYLIPFFSYDIVTARLHEQYKYDNQDQLSVASRERPDLSYTVGLLAEYQLSKKIFTPGRHFLI